MNSEHRITKQADALNSLLRQAIFHGGDAGGPWFSNKDDLELAIENCLATFGLNERVRIEWEGEDMWPLLVDITK